jgi:hypothetical protein
LKPTLAAFFIAEGIVHHESVQEEQNVNCKFYKEATKRRIARGHRVIVKLQDSGPWYLLQDNALAHSSGIVSKFLAKRVSIQPTS